MREGPGEHRRGSETVQDLTGRQLGGRVHMVADLPSHLTGPACLQLLIRRRRTIENRLFLAQDFQLSKGASRVRCGAVHALMAPQPGGEPTASGGPQEHRRPASKGRKQASKPAPGGRLLLEPNQPGRMPSVMKVRRQNAAAS